eukprot:scaffold1616_cov310-Pinguiococcus_pyrenoidosus.AAC.24
MSGTEGLYPIRSEAMRRREQQRYGTQAQQSHSGVAGAGRGGDFSVCRKGDPKAAFEVGDGGQLQLLWMSIFKTAYDAPSLSLVTIRRANAQVVRSGQCKAPSEVPSSSAWAWDPPWSGAGSTSRCFGSWARPSATASDRWRHTLHTRL